MRHLTPIKLGGWILSILVGGALLAGCGGAKGSGSETTTADTSTAARVETPPVPKCPARTGRMQVAIEGHSGPESVGILMAKRRGYFADAGLQVQIKEPAGPDPIPSVGTGDANLGVAPQPQIIIARDEGTPLIGLGSLVSEPTEALIWLRSSGIEGVAGLKGKTIAYPGLTFQRLFLERVLARAGLGLDDVKLKQVGYHLVPVLSSGKADAIFGGSWNLEGAALRARGQHPVVTKVKNPAVAGYNQAVLFAPYECVYKRSGLFRAFLDAMARGTAAAVKEPASAARAVEAGVGAEPGAGPPALAAQVKATLPLLSRDQFLSPQRIALIAWMKHWGMIKEKWPYATIFTNYYSE